MKKFKILIRDVVTDGIYCDYVLDNEEASYYLMTSYDGIYVTMPLGKDETESLTAFYFFSMEFCGMFDTWGKLDFIEHVNRYKDTSSIKRIVIDDFDEIIDVVNVY